MTYTQFSPGLHKLIHHQQHLYNLEQGKIVGPIHVSVWPTNKCQLRCKYCCFRNIERNEIELDINDFFTATDILVKYGLKAMEFSGGGEPLLWKHLDTGVMYAQNKGLKLSLVTNGLHLSYIPSKTLEKFTWIRVSLQSLSHFMSIEFNHIPSNVQKSASFIVYDEHSLNLLNNLFPYAKEKNILIRVAPIRPCTIEWEKLVGEKVKEFGYPFIFFKKEFGTPLGCYMAWLRAAIDWKGNFLPCPSIELGYESEAMIPETFALCHVSKLEEWLQNNPIHDLNYRCSFCNCGKDENDYIYNLLQKVENVEFV